MIIREIVDGLRTLSGYLTVCLAEPEARVHGLLFYEAGMAIESDMLYIVTDGQMPRYELAKGELFQFLWLASETTLPPNQMERMNYIVCRSPRDYTTCMNRIEMMLGQDYRNTRRQYELGQTQAWQGTVEDLLRQGFRAVGEPMLYIDLMTDQIRFAPPQGVWQKQYPSLWQEIGKGDKAFRRTIVSLTEHGLQDDRKEIDLHGIPIHVRRLTIDKYDRGLLLLCGRHTLDEMTQRLFDAMTDMLRSQLGARTGEDQLLQSGTSFLVNDMITHRHYPKLMLERVLEAFSFPSAGRFIFASLGFPNQTSAAVLRYLTEDVVRWLPHVLWTIHGGTIVLFISAGTDSREKKDGLPGEMKQPFDIFRFLHKKYGVHIGVSQAFTLDQDVFAGYRQSRTALSYAGRITDAGFEYYVLYEMVQQVDFFSRVAKEMDLMEYCSADILRLLAYDKEHDSHLSQTLAVYLNSFGDGVYAAQKLGIHKNSLYYRLGMIRKIVGNELTDGETNYTYMFTFRALQILGKFDPVDM